MKKIKYIITIVIFMAVAATALFAGTRHTKEEEHVINTTNVVAGKVVYIRTKACDPDGDPLVIEYEDSPSGMEAPVDYVILREDAPLDDPNCLPCVENLTSTWYGSERKWTPTHEQIGTYRMFIHAFDDKGGEEWVVHIINVVAINRPPVL